MLSFSVINWFAWSPNLISKEDWLAWSKNPIAPSGNSKIATTTVPSTLKRRCSHFNKMALEVSNQSTKKNPIDYAVFCSQHGDLNQTIKLLEELCDKTPLSPTRFSQSLHNASTGLFSIINKLQENMNSLAAGENTFLVGMLEIITWLKLNPNKTALLTMSDEYIPEEYQSLNIKNNNEYAIALLLRNPPLNQKTISLTLENCCEKTSNKNLPQALEFLAWLLQPIKKNLLSQNTKHQVFTWNKKQL